MDVFLEFLRDLVVTVFVLGTVGLAVSWALLRGFKPLWVVMTGSFAMAFFILVSALLEHPGQGAERFAFFSQYFDAKHFEEQWQVFLQSMGKMGLDSEKLVSYKPVFQKYVYWSLPALEAVRCLVWGILLYYAVSLLLARFSRKVAKPVAFREWIVPEPIIFGLIIAGFLKELAKENSWMDILGSNLLVFFLGLYSLGGLSIVSFFFYKWRLPAAARFLGYLAILFLTYVFSFFSLGVLDVWLDFRKIKMGPKEGAQLS